MLPTSKKATYVFTSMDSLLQQLKKRRLALGLKQNDMLLRVGVSRQQYQHLESKGNPRLDTLELLAEGLNSSLLLIPKEKLTAVLALLEKEPTVANPSPASPTAGIHKGAEKNLYDDPWQDILGDNE